MPIGPVTKGAGACDEALDDQCQASLSHVVLASRISFEAGDVSAPASMMGNLLGSPQHMRLAEEARDG